MTLEEKFHQTQELINLNWNDGKDFTPLGREIGSWIIAANITTK